ncbi:hypothetical protein P0136_02885 [Lentisphaerota bacterium ZTH]|nr:hypothetical protein JYG24_05975 [Lentisphaerota bacterium]WET06947.1 hypothetical protein P0136_02885 [Lentisphaerota bacterium ZTH]
MKRFSFIFLLFALLALPAVLKGNDIELFKISKDILVPPSIAENGNSYIFIAKSVLTNLPTVYVSYQKRNGKFSNPVHAFDLNTVPEGLSEHFKNFNPSKPSRGWTGFESPTVQDKIITFGGTLESGKRGAFYAQNIAGKWHVFPLVLQGQVDKNGNKFKYFNAPYITTDSKALFMATMVKMGTENETYDAVFSCKIRNFFRPSTPKLLIQANEHIYNFDDISVAQAKFATRADTNSGTQNMFIYDGTSQLIKTVPDKYRFLDRGEASIQLGGPTYYAGKIAFFAHSFDKNNKYISAIYCNAGDNNFSKPIVHTNKKYKIAGTKGYTIFTGEVSNPTLFIKGRKASVTFMGYPKTNSKRSGVYLATIKSGKVKLSAIAFPGQILPEGGEVKSVQIGAVSIRHDKVPIMVTLKSGIVKIGVVNVD